MSWLTQVMPYMENAALHDLIDQDKSYREPENAQASETSIDELRCPTTGTGLAGYHLIFDGTGTTTLVENLPYVAHYVAIMGAKAVCPRRPSDVTDYPESTYTMENCSDSLATIGGWANNGVMYPLSRTRHSQITDGLSKTMLIGEHSWLGIEGKRMWTVGAAGTAVFAKDWNDIERMRWMDNAENVAFVMEVSTRALGFPNNDVSLGSEHPGGAHVAMADGSVHFLSEDTPIELLWAMASRGSEEVYELP